VQHEGDNVRLAIDLVDAIALRQLQAATIDARLQDLTALQDGVVTASARMLDVALHPTARRLLAAGGTSVPRAYDLYLQAQGYLQRSDNTASLDRAISLFEQALKQDPNFAAAHASLGRAYWRRYQDTREPQWMEKARNSCSRAIALNDLSAPAHVYLGQISASTGHSDQAVVEFRKALALDPVNAEAYRGLAGTYDTAGETDEAETVYKHAIDLRPNQLINYSYLGAFYYRHGRYSEAEPIFRRILELSPDNYVWSRLLGSLYTAMDRYDEAAKVLETALAISPNAANYNNLANVYYFQKRYKEAAGLMAKALALTSNDYRYWSTLADIYSATPDTAQKARTTYLQALKLAQQELAVNPNDGEVLSDIAVYRARTSDKTGALADIERALQLAGNDKDVVQSAVMVYEITGDRDRALHALEGALKKGYPVEEIRRQPGLAALRKDPRYRRLISDGR
jgi:tetratricopeptide (TPR) repeat protein